MLEEDAAHLLDGMGIRLAGVRRTHDQLGGPESFEYGRWMVERAFLIVPAQAAVGQWLQSFKEFPIRQKPASFNLDGMMRKLSPAQ